MNDSRNTTAAENTKSGEMSEFEKLMQKVADMPQDEQEKVAFFVNGYIAAKMNERGAAAV